MRANARVRRRPPVRLPALAAGALAIASCAFQHSTIPRPFLRPGARVFYVKVARETNTDTTTYKVRSVVTTVQCDDEAVTVMRGGDADGTPIGGPRRHQIDTPRRVAIG